MRIWGPATVPKFSGKAEGYILILAGLDASGPYDRPPSTILPRNLDTYNQKPMPLVAVQDPRRRLQFDDCPLSFQRPLARFSAVRLNLRVQQRVSEC